MKHIHFSLFIELWPIIGLAPWDVNTMRGVTKTKQIKQCSWIPSLGAFKEPYLCFGSTPPGIRKRVSAPRHILVCSPSYFLRDTSPFHRRGLNPYGATLINKEISPLVLEVIAKDQNHKIAIKVNRIMTNIVRTSIRIDTFGNPENGRLIQENISRYVYSA